MSPEALHKLGDKPEKDLAAYCCPVCGEDSADIVTVMKSLSGGIYHKDDAYHCDECNTVFDASGVIPCEEYEAGHAEHPPEREWDKDEWKERQR